MKKYISMVIVAVLVGALALSACGKAGNGRKASNAVVVGISQDIDSLDPHSMAYAGTREVLFNLYEGLVKATSDGNVTPAVASEYEVTDDAKTLTFKLRDGVKFWDGTPVTTDDILYSIDRYAKIQGDSAGFGIMESITVEGDLITIQLSEPSTEFIYLLTCAIIPASYADDGSAPAGTGPFKFVSHEPGQELKVAKNEYYWMDGIPYLDTVTFKVVADTDTAVLQLNSGTLDIYQYLTSDQAASLQNEKFNVLVGNVNYVQGLFLNNAAKPFDDIRVRKALYMAVDRQMISDMLFDGTSHIIGTHCIPAAAKYYNAETEGTYKYDPEEAKKLLKEAGYPDGFEFTIIVPNNYAPHEGTAQIIADCLEKVGVKAEIQLVEFTTWYSEVYADRNFEASIVAMDGKLSPNSWFVKNVSTGSKNFTNYSNPEYDEIYNKAMAETDLDQKAEYYKQLQKILADDAASIYIQDPSNLVAVAADLEGYVFYPISAQDMSVVKYK